MSSLAASTMPAESDLVRCTNSARQEQQLTLVLSVHGHRGCRPALLVEGSDFQRWCYSSSVTSTAETASERIAAASSELSLVMRFSSALALVASAAFVPSAVAVPSASVRAVTERPASRTNVGLASLWSASSPCWSHNFETAPDYT